MKKSVFLFATVLFFAMSCTKEQRIDKNLWKNGGKWDIEKLSNTSISPDTTYTDSHKDVGIMRFREDGTGFVMMSIENFEVARDFDYFQKETELTLIIDEEDEYGNPNQVAVYEMEWSKNEIELKMFEPDPDDEEYGEKSEMKLVKRK